MKTIKRSVLSIFVVGLFAFMFTSCNSNDEELKNQVNALQTQNALLQENLDSQEIQVEAPQPPSGESSGAVFVEKTPTIESLPTNPVPAGQPIIYDGWAITVSKEININSYEEIWGIDIFVRNTGETGRIFRFTNSSITATDNFGNVYEASTLCPYMGCESCEQYYYQVKNLEIEGETSKTISSGTNGNGCMYEDGVGMFKGPISLSAEQLIIHFTDFGPISNVDVVIDL